MNDYIIMLTLFASLGILLGVISGLRLRRAAVAMEAEEKEEALSFDDAEFFANLARWIALDFDSLPLPPDLTAQPSPLARLVAAVLALSHSLGPVVCSCLVFLYLAQLVAAAENDDLLAWTNAGGGAVWTAGTMFTATMRTAVSNSIGMTPKKNWDYLMTLIAAQPATSTRAVFVAMILCHFTANVHKWDKAIVAMKANLPTGNWAPIFTELESLITHILVWDRVGAHPTGKFLSQRLLTSNPGLAASAFRLAKSAGERSVPEFCKMKYAPAIDFAADMDTDLRAGAEWVAANVLHKTFREEFYNTVKKSNFWLYNKPTGTGAMSTTRFGTAPLTKAELTTWLAQ